MTTPVQKRPKREQFEQAEQQWDLERLFRDLAAFKKDKNNHSQNLTRVEKLHLRGLLCGHSPAEIAKQLNKEVHGVETALSATIYSYLKDLLDGKKIENWRNVSQYLEEAGYKKPLTVVSSNQLPEITLPIKSLAGLEGLITVINQRFCNNQNNQKFVEINIRLVVPVSEEGKMEDSSSSE